ncbi:MBL fold metallo-hydrolase [Bacillus sp. FJAT-42376]|uniref:MBL fold metallo-hydrolase n=1 Tax=Bacillus sp. FJAT-42376 TaxID=2014076 RepID=UPI000F4EF818|nr:MBL fold metallo-hydrolase [Bacillus sp. FJAT-42376]AZB43610.1 MBL fold metallo-hydrolase [Bacillus sp. FJAT-42376]
MNWERIPLGPLQTNCYILSNKEKECIIFDPGSEGIKLNRHIQSRGLKPLAILLTHAHFDHIGAVDEVRDKWNVPVYAHKKEKDWLPSPELNGSHFFQAGPIHARPADEYVQPGKPLAFKEFNFDVLYTPGHSPGSVSYYHKETESVFSGDVLFKEGVGRTDLPGGDHELLMKSIHDQLLNLPENTIVLSGHGTETTIQDEMDRNPFLNGF